MSKHELMRKFIVEVPGGEEITYFAIEEARFRFKRDTTHNPEKIVMTPVDYRKLMADERNQSTILDPDTFMGMRIKIDPSLKDGEWKLIREEAKTYATE